MATAVAAPLTRVERTASGLISGDRTASLRPCADPTLSRASVAATALPG